MKIAIALLAIAGLCAFAAAEEAKEDQAVAESRYHGHGHGHGYGHVGYGHGGYGQVGHGHGGYRRGGYGHGGGYRWKRDTEAQEAEVADLTESESRVGYGHGYGHGYGQGYGHGHASRGYGHGGYSHGGYGHYRGKRDTEAQEVEVADLTNAESRVYGGYNRGYGHVGGYSAGHGHLGGYNAGYGYGHRPAYGHYRGKRDTEAQTTEAELEGAESRLYGLHGSYGYGGLGHGYGAGYGHGASYYPAGGYGGHYNAYPSYGYTSRLHHW